MHRAGGFAADAFQIRQTPSMSPSTMPRIAGAMGISLASMNQAIQVSTGSPAEASTLIKSGKVKLRAAMTPQRIPAFPDAPTLKELGLDWELQSFLSLMGPKGMPKEAVATLAAAMKKVQASAEWKSALDARGFGLNTMGAAELGKFAAKSDKELGGVMKAIGVAK
jgi:tripartite-type tricarboxylate transporter receptor subunit TctC